MPHRFRQNLVRDQRGVAPMRRFLIPSGQVMECAFQNEMAAEDAQELIANGTWCCLEVSNMGCQPGAIEAFQKAGILFARK